MKHILLLISLFTMNSLFAQQNSVVVKVQGQTLTADLNEDNNEQILVIKSSSKWSKTSKFVIYNSNKAEVKTWKRSFTIYDESDNEIVNFFSPTKGLLYQLPLPDVLSKLKKGTDYYLYTIAIPADPKKAAVVRVRRVLVCKIEVK